MTRFNSLKFIRFISSDIKKIGLKVHYLLTKSPLRRFFPLKSLFIETTTYCNLKCVGCYRSLHNYPAKNKHMLFKDFKKYVDQVPSTFFLTLHGLGEPTLNPDIVKIVNYASKLGKFNTITFTTNLLGNKLDIYRTLFSKGLTNIVISVDSLEKDCVNKMRPFSDVKKLTKKLKIMHEEFADKISISVVISKENVHNFKNLVNNLAKLGVKKISTQPFDDLGNSKICLSTKEKKNFLNEFEGIKHPLMEINFSSWFRKVTIPCNNPLTSPVITVDGYITPCCRFMDKNILNFGNLNETSFKKIFFSRKFTRLQKNIDKGKYPLVCKGCVGNHSEN